MTPAFPGLSDDATVAPHRPTGKFALRLHRIAGEWKPRVSQEAEREPGSDPRACGQASAQKTGFTTKGTKVTKTSHEAREFSRARRATSFPLCLLRACFVFFVPFV